MKILLVKNDDEENCEKILSVLSTHGIVAFEHTTTPFNLFKEKFDSFLRNRDGDSEHCSYVTSFTFALDGNYYYFYYNSNFFGDDSKVKEIVKNYFNHIE